MNSNATMTPPALLHNLEHNKVLHERVIFLTVKTELTPSVAPDERVKVEPLSQGLYRIRILYGFMEDPDIPQALENLHMPGLELNLRETSYFLGRETIISTKRPGMARWREKLFSLISRNATTATAYFGLPPGRVVELGEQIEI